MKVLPDPSVRQRTHSSPARRGRRWTGTPRAEGTGRRGTAETVRECLGTLVSQGDRECSQGASGNEEVFPLVTVSGENYRY